MPTKSTKKPTRPQKSELAPYEVLGVSPKASPAEVNAAYKVLAQIFHPDRFADSPENVRREAEVRMKALNEAYGLARKGFLVSRPPPGSTNGPGGRWGPGYSKWAGVPWEEACRRRAAQAAEANEARRVRERSTPSGNAIPRPRKGQTFPSVMTGLGLAQYTNNITCKGCRTLQWLPQGWEASLDHTVYYCSSCGRLILSR